MARSIGNVPEVGKNLVTVLEGISEFKRLSPSSGAFEQGQ